MAEQVEPSAAGRQGTNWRGWALLALIAVLAIIVLQNFEEVRIDILIFTSVRMPLIIALLLAALLGALIAWLAARFERRD